MSEMKAKIGRRLTDEETKKAAVLAACIDASPHEWPEAVSEVALVCHGYLDQQARICELEAQLADARLDSARLTYIIEETCLLHKDYLSEWVIDEAFTLRDNDAEDEGVADQAMVRALIDQHMKESK